MAYVQPPVEPNPPHGREELALSVELARGCLVDQWAVVHFAFGYHSIVPSSQFLRFFVFFTFFSGRHSNFEGGGEVGVEGEEVFGVVAVGLEGGGTVAFSMSRLKAWRACLA